jgi:predicted O-methyltransferase YrrM
VRERAPITAASTPTWAICFCPFRARLAASCYVLARARRARAVVEFGTSFGLSTILLDGAKVLSPRILALLEPRLASGALVVADNAADSPELLTYVRDAANGYVAVPFGSDVEFIMRA